MHLRLWEDFLTDRGVLSLPALPRMLFVVRGAAMVGTRPLGQGEAWQGEDAVAVRASDAGATIWRWDLSSGAPAPWRNGPGVFTREKHSARLETCPRASCSGAATAWRSRRAAAPICIAIRAPASVA